MTEPSPPVGVSQRYLNGSYLSVNPDWHDRDGQWKASQIIEILRRNNLDPPSICDIGCGTGAVLRRLGQTYPSAELYGYEPGIAQIRATDPVSGPPISNIDPRTRDRRWDLLLMVDVVEHVEDYLGFLRSHSHLASNFVVHLPLDLSVQSVLRSRPLLYARQTVGHLHYFTRETGLATLHDAGYRVVDCFLTPGGLESPSLTKKQKLASLPRRVMYHINGELAARVLGGFSLLILAVER